MSPALKQWIRNNTLLAAVLVFGALWLGWNILVGLYLMLLWIAGKVFLHLEASYGQAGGPLGYALLGLGLGAAAGAVAAQRRYRLNRRIAVAAALVAGALVALAYVGSLWADSTETVEAAPPMDNNSGSAAPVVEATLPPVASPVPAPPDTATQLVEELRLSTSRLALLTDWRDSTSAAMNYWPADTLRLWRRAPGWALVSPQAPVGQPPPVSGWVRLASLAPLPPPVAAPAPVGASTPLVITRRTASPAADSARVGPAEGPPAGYPVGEQQASGQIGDQATQYTLSWQANGELSGSYYYEQQPTTRHRLTGSLDASGELHLLEFTRGQQSARCVLQRQADGYAGTLYSNDGQQLPMRILLAE